MGFGENNQSFRKTRRPFRSSESIPSNNLSLVDFNRPAFSQLPFFSTDLERKKPRSHFSTAELLILNYFLVELHPTINFKSLTSDVVGVRTS